MYKIRYSNCWEDTDVLLTAINPKPNRRYLSIASAGDNTLALLSADPEKILAVDINPSQIAALEIRMAAFKILDYHDLLKFLGIKPCNQRLDIYVKLRHSLSSNSRYFWDKNPLYIKEGLIHCGRVENYLKRFRKWILPFLISRKKRRQLFMPPQGCLNILAKDDINSWRWHLFTRFFFSKLYLAKMDLGRTKSIYRQIAKNIPALVLERIQHALTAVPSVSNPYLEYIVRGNYFDNLPYYLQKNNFQKIHGNLARLQIFNGSLKQALDGNSGTFFDGFNLSDIFEYMDIHQFNKTFDQILNHCEPGARIVYWNNLVERIPLKAPERLRILDETANDLFSKNRSFFYGSLIIAEAASN